MNKTEMRIERDFYSFVKTSNLGMAVKGDVYRSEMRPPEAVTEDLVVKFLAGVDGQFQSGVIIINIYVPDVFTNEGVPVADKRRIGELQELLYSFIEDNQDTEYLISLDGTPQTMRSEGLNQHFIYSRLKFRTITF